jgi:DNA-binding GntR family transcriptional regulator
MVTRRPERLADEFRQKIELGEWAVGARLPTTRELADAYNVSVNTIQTAFRELQADDLVERRPGVGGFVKKPLSAFQHYAAADHHRCRRCL